MSEDEPSGAPGVRIQALIARAGIASRRAAEDMIRSGRVSLNGRVVTELGVRATPEDSLTVDGKQVVAEAKIHRLVLNKPPGYLCAMSDDFGRPLAASLFKPQIQERVYNIGRLDLDSCGLIMFTNDGAFAARVGHPSSGLVKEYYVETDCRVPNDFGKRFESGIADDGEVLKAERATITGERRCEIRLVEGKNREIRRALASFGLKAIVLKRVAIGPVRLGGLVEGRWRSLTDEELASLGMEGTI
ncbi:MAG: rRNA pseudouridine synthase [Spirochaetae bacterium HGW-Spirochaetae-3]|jgi:23S rRNA pseudouridine2605 synthase|nr:MAG: rRNA pseudouridine synthase [Spirochaetae bacterium HGW-Spirochaetae-3]